MTNLYKKKKSHLCSFSSKLFEPQLIDMSAREFLQKNYDNKLKLRQFAERIQPFFKKMFFYKRDSLEFFNQDYRWSHQDYQNATHLEMSMQEIIDNDR